MKIIVDEMPETYAECCFCITVDGCSKCILDGPDGDYCDMSMDRPCMYLKELNEVEE